MTGHGGDIYNAKNRIIHDFSVNLNPSGPMPEVISAAVNSLHNIDSYPDTYCTELRTALVDKIRSTHFVRPTSSAPGNFHDAAIMPTPEMITLGNGAAELIMVLCRVLPLLNGRTEFLLPAPGFSEYERGVIAAGWEATFYSADDMLCNSDVLSISEDTCAVFICNPNNPTGRLTDSGKLLSLIRRCHDLNVYVVVDECFLPLSDMTEGYSKSMIRYLNDFSNLIILRSFTKTFAIPGLRLGYMLTADYSVSHAVAEQLPCWNISVPAQAAGLAALWNIDPYLADSRKKIQREREFLADELKKDEYTSLIRKVYPSDTCFILLECYVNLYELLLAKGFLIRDCSNFRNLPKDTYRIAVKSHEENLALLEALKSCAR